MAMEDGADYDGAEHGKAATLSATDRVLVHVGAPKTGTSRAGRALAQPRIPCGAGHPLSRGPLRRALPGGARPDGAALGRARGTRPSAPGTVSRSGSGLGGTAIVSHEILATASRQQVRRALDSFGEAEVHFVLSARDLVRQIPAEWQENVKHRRTLAYRDFLDSITDDQRRSELASWFWGVQEIPEILDRWGESLPPERVHLVTVPRPAQQGLLWQRFASVLGLDAAALAPDTTRSNPSLGVPETTLPDGSTSA